MLTLRDVILFFVVSGTNLQWVALAAAAGSTSLLVWVVGMLLMFVPLSVCVVELTARHPEEGGLYVWSRKAFGPFAGFMTGWTYWCSNLPYFPGLLYFAAGNALYVSGAFRGLSSSGPYFIGFSILGLALATLLNVLGLQIGKWLNNVGAITRWLATLCLIAIGAAAFLTSGPARSFPWASLVPGLSLVDLAFFSGIAFALTGPEAIAFMGDEIHDPRRTVPRGLLVAAPMIAAIYLLGTLSVLVALPPSQVSGLTGVMQAVEAAAARVGLEWMTPLAAVLMTITALGSVGAWLESVARIPFVAGLDRHLPERFARLHPRWGTPVNGLMAQSLLTVVFIVMSQAGTTVRGAYQVLLGMTFLVTFIPFLFVFASAIRLTREPGPGGWRVPGGRPVLVTLASVGLLTTLASICLSVIPSASETNKPLAVAKVVGGTALLVGAGVATYAGGRRRATRSAYG